MAIFAPLGYSAYPKRGVAFASHILLSTIFVATIWARLGDQGFPVINLILGALISGAFMEVWVAFLPKLKAGRSDKTWMWEMGWLAIMAIIGTAIFIGITTSWSITGFKPLQMIFSALLGMLGWFLGDLFNQYHFFRKTGLWGNRDR